LAWDYTPWITSFNNEKKENNPKPMNQALIE
jgi:hypothetical protein